MSRSRALDGVRGVAIIAVMAEHTNGPIGRGGFLGVDLFFVLSGYLITTILMREHDRTDRVSLLKFYARRALRLYPALLVTCVLALILVRSVDFANEGAAIRGAGTAAAYLTDVGVILRWDFVNGLFYTWSLAIEEHFYLVWPAVLFACIATGRERWLPRIAAIGLAWSLVALIVLPHVMTGAMRYAVFRPDSRGGALLVGCLIALMYRRTVRRPAAWIGWAGLLLALALFQGAHGDENSLTNLGVTIPLMWLASAALVSELAVGEDRLLARLLGCRPLAYLGLISYGLYLYHLLAYRAMVHWLNVSRSVDSAVAIVISLAISAASYHWVEMPFLRLKKRFDGGGDIQALPPDRAASQASRENSGVPATRELWAPRGSNPEPTD